MNAFGLWIFGNALEREIGRLSMLAVFLVTGIFASAASYLFSTGPRWASGRPVRSSDCSARS